MEKIIRIIAAAPLLLALVYSQLAFDISLEFCHCTQGSSASAKSIGPPHDLNKHKDAFQHLALFIIPAGNCQFQTIRATPLDAEREVRHRICAELRRSNPGRAPPAV